MLQTCIQFYLPILKSYYVYKFPMINSSPDLVLFLMNNLALISWYPPNPVTAPRKTFVTNCHSAADEKPRVTVMDGSSPPWHTPAPLGPWGADCRGTTLQLCRRPTSSLSWSIRNRLSTSDISVRAPEDVIIIIVQLGVDNFPWGCCIYVVCWFELIQHIGTMSKHFQIGGTVEF